MLNVSRINETIYLDVIFHYQKELLEEKVLLPHNTPGKAICFVIEDYKEYFIIKAILELPNKDTTTSKRDGVVGIDINVDHIALSVINHHGNLVGTKIIKYQLKEKTTNKRKWILREVAKEVIEVCEKNQKHLIVEELDFVYKKQQMKYKNKVINAILSSFAYKQIIETLEARAYKKAVEVESVNPAYTSKIGKEKYKEAKGLSVHLSASFVIARRGMGFE